MIIRNRRDTTFGPFGSSAGLFLLAGGLLATWFSPLGLIMVIAGAFAAFTSTSAHIDTANMKVRQSDNLFGIFPVGKWIKINPDMKIGKKKYHRGFVGRTRGPLPYEIHKNDIRIVLYDSNKRLIMPLKKSRSNDATLNDLNELGMVLGLPVI